MVRTRTAKDNRINSAFAKFNASQAEKLANSFLNREIKRQQELASSDYASALHLFWNAQYDASIEKVSQILASDSDHPFQLPLYRLWIENLSCLNRQGDLAILQDHLLNRGLEEPDAKIDYMALRGLTHLMRDEIDAAETIGLALSNANDGEVDSFYVAEYFQNLNGFNPEVFYQFVHCEKPMDDFFHWACFSRISATYLSHEFNVLILEGSKTRFPGNPLLDELTMHHCFETKYFIGALHASQSLYENFPQNSNYQFFSAFAKFQCNDYQGVIDILEGGRIYQGGDPDFLNLLGRVYTALGRSSDRDDYIQRAVNYLEKASVLARPFMLSAYATDSILQDLKDKFLAGSEQFDEMIATGGLRHWVIKLDPSLRHEIAHKPISEIQNLARPMGHGPRVGDLCFLVADASYQAKGEDSTDGRWVVVALYEVKTPSAYDPIYGSLTGIELIERLADRVTVDVKMMDQGREQKSSVPRNHPSRFGVYEMDDEGFATLTDAVRRRNLGVDHIKERRGSTLSQKKLS